MALALSALVGYVLGSIMFADILVRFRHGGDIGAHGSGNPGFTNVFRTYGAATGVPVLLGDMGKGAIAVALAMFVVAPRAAGDPELCGLLAAVLSVVGHALPLFHGFKGGKGVATASGAFLVLTPAALGVASLVFFATVAATRFVSLGSMLGAIALAVWLTWFMGERSSAILAAVGWVVAAAIVLRHRSNVGRLARGEERRFTFKRS